MKSALSTFGRALRLAAQGENARIDLLTPAGIPLARMDAAHWSGGLVPGDEAMLEVCHGSTIDVGCGPGRLVAALQRRNISALGIDISSEAVAQARRQGARAKLCDVFRRVPGEGRWDHVLLADGNIGIGGDPVALLARCMSLTAPRGTLIVELGQPGSGSWRRPVRLRHAGLNSPLFWWAAVAADDLAGVCVQACLRVMRQWSVQGRWFASVAKDRGGC